MARNRRILHIPMEWMNEWMHQCFTMEVTKKKKQTDSKYRLNLCHCHYQISMQMICPTAVVNKHFSAVFFNCQNLSSSCLLKYNWFRHRYWTNFILFKYCLIHVPCELMSINLWPVVN
jgi:hypothetical protein